MKFSDIKYYIDRDNLLIENVSRIGLSKKLFEIILNELCKSCESSIDHFEYVGIKFSIDFDRNYIYGDYYAIIYFNNTGFGYGYEILTEAERAIKNILE